MMQKPIEPAAVVQEVEQYVEAQMDDARAFSNRELLDESGIYSLHLLAADLYQAGFNDGIQAERTRTDGELRRARAKARQVEKPGGAS